MRLWSLHPRYLDARGLVALWREALLAQAVLRGQTRGYTHHPQLQRFHAMACPETAIAAYLQAVLEESQRRGYTFDATKVGVTRGAGRMTVSHGQLDHEWEHLCGKLQVRDPARLADLASVRHPEPHPLFDVVPGPVAVWEIVRDPGETRRH